MGILTWIILGLVAGAIAKLLMPGRDPGGWIVTMLLGVAGAFVGGWIGGMLWWSGEHHPAYIILLAICGSIGGYLWFLAMSWMFQHLPPLNGNQGGGRKAP